MAPRNLLVRIFLHAPFRIAPENHTARIPQMTLTVMEDTAHAAFEAELIATVPHTLRPFIGIAPQQVPSTLLMHTVNRMAGFTSCSRTAPSHLPQSQHVRLARRIGTPIAYR
jgi:hypothetical protein